MKHLKLFNENVSIYGIRQVFLRDKDQRKNIKGESISRISLVFKTNIYQ